MDKLLTAMGIALILIGITFGGYGFVENPDGLFWKGTAIWTVGSVTLVLSLFAFTKEEGFLTGR